MSRHTDWDFKPGKVTYHRRSRGKLPHLKIGLYANGIRIGFLEVHTHHHAGRDKRTDVSFGITAVVEHLPR